MPKKKRTSIKYVDHPSSRYDNFMNSFVYLAFSENEEIRSKYRKIVVDRGIQEWKRNKETMKKLSAEQFEAVLKNYESINQLTSHDVHNYGGSSAALQSTPSSPSTTGNIMLLGSGNTLPTLPMLLQPQTMQTSASASATSPLFQTTDASTDSATDNTQDDDSQKIISDSTNGSKKRPFEEILEPAKAPATKRMKKASSPKPTKTSPRPLLPHATLQPMHPSTDQIPWSSIPLFPYFLPQMVLPPQPNPQLTTPDQSSQLTPSSHHEEGSRSPQKKKTARYDLNHS